MPSNTMMATAMVKRSAADSYVGNPPGAMQTRMATLPGTLSSP
jgi:hypothetical protein